MTGPGKVQTYIDQVASLVWVEGSVTHVLQLLSLNLIERLS